jgi:hypothetical protein
VEGAPLQLLTVGVTVIVAVIAVVPVFVPVNDAMSPEPLAANPIAVLEFVQAKVPPDGVLEKLVAATTSLLQTEMLAGTVAVEVGFTVMV